MERVEGEFEDLYNPPPSLKKVPLHKVKGDKISKVYDDHVMEILTEPDADMANKKIKKLTKDADRIFRNRQKP